MMKTAALFLAASLATLADAGTTVAVLELGKGGTVRRTSSKSPKTSVNGVASFWSSLHGGRHLAHAHPDQTVVRDLFNKADAGLVIGIAGVDLMTMPTINGFVETEGTNHVVGHLEVSGAQARPLLNKIGIAEEATASTLKESASKKASTDGLSALRLTVEDPAAVDKEVASMIHSLHKEALDAGRTVVVHLVVEEEEGAGRKRRLSRRLEDRDEEGESQDEEGEEDKDGEEGEEGEEGDANNKGNNGGFYGYGYYDAYGNWVTPYKTMFQIQYFNVVLWTSLGLIAVLFFSIYMVINMPLMADTLLFGESAKMAGE